MTADEALELEPYGLAQADKDRLMGDRLAELTEHHRVACAPYARILAATGYNAEAAVTPEDAPALPIGLFKSHLLASVPEEEIFKVVTSSGTSGAAVSRIALDRAAAARQTRALAVIMTHWLGHERLPMIIVDAKATLRDRRSPSARGAGILGMATFGRDHLYALDDEMRLDHAALATWLAKHAGEPILLFGFTFMVWRYLVQQLEPGEADLSRGVLVHSGGWKRLAEEAVDDRAFRAELERVAGLRRVHNFYGMAEQIGTVFVQCEAGELHAPAAADVIVREPVGWTPLPAGQTGVIEVVSMLPESYPGHAILTEDLGEVTHVDDCPCGRAGRTVRIEGRVPRTELRGCSDTHAAAVV